MAQHDFELLDVPLRGRRDYLHSTDTFMSLRAQLIAHYGAENISSIKIKFSSICTLLPKFRVVPSSEKFFPSQLNTIVADFQLSDGQRHLIDILESDEKPSKRIEGNESEVSQSVILGENSATLPRNMNADLVEHAVFASKQLHYNEFPIEDAIWMVAEVNLMLSQVDEGWKQMKVNLDMHRDATVTSSSIFADNQKIGSIRYIKVDR